MSHMDFYQAYADIYVILKKLACLLKKDINHLRIYDRYYCAGTVKKHLGSLGFVKVYNECEDFYKMLEEKKIPDHDVVVTNPPYSGDHVHKLLKFCKENGKPFLLLMPNYVLNKAYFDSGNHNFMFLIPKKRYCFWTPKALKREKEKRQNHASALGHR